MMVFCCLILAVFVQFQFTSGQNLTESRKTGLSLNLNLEWSAWVSCALSENCHKKRTRTCRSNPIPYESCKNEEFEERIENCFDCEFGSWIQKSKSSCSGEGCEKTQQTVYSCSNRIRQPNCQRRTTKFCDLEKTCVGTWTSWSYTQCSKNSILFPSQKLRTRHCMNNHFFGYSCVNKLQQLSDHEFVPCNHIEPTSSGRDSTTTTTTTTTTKTIPRLTLTPKGRGVPDPKPENNSLTPSNKDRIINDPNLWWSDKTYILIIQSIIIFILLVIVFCLLYLRFKKKKPKEEPIPIVRINKVNRSHSVAYSHLNMIHINGSDLDFPEYERMFPRDKILCSPNERPLPEKPSLTSSFKPQKPPRRNRASITLTSPPSISLTTSETTDLSIFKELQPVYSAPSTPAVRKMPDIDKRYGSVGKLNENENYLLPVN